MVSNAISKGIMRNVSHLSKSRVSISPRPPSRLFSVESWALPTVLRKLKKKAEKFIFVKHCAVIEILVLATLTKIPRNGYSDYSFELFSLFQISKIPRHSHKIKVGLQGEKILRARCSFSILLRHPWRMLDRIRLLISIYLRVGLTTPHTYAFPLSTRCTAYYLYSLLDFRMASLSLRSGAFLSSIFVLICSFNIWPIFCRVPGAILV